jgi:hypothetical protein
MTLKVSVAKAVTTPLCSARIVLASAWRCQCCCQIVAKLANPAEVTACRSGRFRCDLPGRNDRRFAGMSKTALEDRTAVFDLGGLFAMAWYESTPCGL